MHFFPKRKLATTKVPQATGISMLHSLPMVVWRDELSCRTFSSANELKTLAQVDVEDIWEEEHAPYNSVLGEYTYGSEPSSNTVESVILPNLWKYVTYHVAYFFCSRSAGRLSQTTLRRRCWLLYPRKS